MHETYGTYVDGMDETYDTYVDDECFDIHDYDDDTDHDTDDDTDDDTNDDADDDTDDGGRGNLFLRQRFFKKIRQGRAPSPGTTGGGDVFKLLSGIIGQTQLISIQKQF